jgi:hypothetical protein
LRPSLPGCKPQANAGWSDAVVVAFNFGATIILLRTALGVLFYCLLEKTKQDRAC